MYRIDTNEKHTTALDANPTINSHKLLHIDLLDSNIRCWAPPNVAEQIKFRGVWAKLNEKQESEEEKTNESQMRHYLCIRIFQTFRN